MSPAVPLWMDRAHDNLRCFCTSATELAEFVKLNLVICKIVKKKKIKITTVPTHNPPTFIIQNNFDEGNIQRNLNIYRWSSITDVYYSQYCRPHPECYKSVWRYDIRGKATYTVQSALFFLFLFLLFREEGSRDEV